MKIKTGFYSFFPGGGIGRYTAALMTALSDRNDVDVNLICSSDFQYQDVSNVSVFPVLNNLSHSIPLIRRIRFLWAQIVNPLRAIQTGKEEGIQVLHFANINPLTFPFWKTQLKGSGIRMAISVHDVRRQKAILNQKWEEYQLKAMYAFADALFVHSEVQATELMAFANVSEQKIHIVPHGPYAYPFARTTKEEIRKQLQISSDRMLILFFGQIRDEKNLDALLQAIALLPEHVHLLVAGQAGSRHKGSTCYQDIVRKHGIENRVYFRFGHVPDEEVGDLFTACDCVALPYRSDFTSQSGVLNIAAFFERPVFVSNAPVLKETVQTSGIGLVCSDDTPQALAIGIGKMEELIKQRTLFPFKDYLQRFSWLENARITSEVYRNILSEQGSVQIN